MKMLFAKLRERGVGVRRHTMEDFHSFCEAEGIRILRSEFRFSFYFSVGRHPFIVLPRHLTGARLLFEALHEGAHHSLSAGETALYGGDSKDEAQADAVALISMMPDATEPWDDSQCSQRLLRRRQEFKALYDI
jgi:hypothetical protein